MLQERAGTLQCEHTELGSDFSCKPVLYMYDTGQGTGMHMTLQGRRRGFWKWYDRRSARPKALLEGGWGTFPGKIL